MKIYISVDIEGCTGFNTWDEDSKMAEIMTQEAIAACKGALKAGADEVYLKDAHDTALNIDLQKMIPGVKLIRGWPYAPFGMAAFLDKTFDAVAFVGFHSEAGTNLNPTPHTFNPKYYDISINGKVIGELDIGMMGAAALGIPTIFLAGDLGLVERHQEILHRVATNDCLGKATLMLHTCEEACQLIENEMFEAVSNIKKQKLTQLPKDYLLTVRYIEPVDAYRASFYPGMQQTDARTVTLKTKKLNDILTALRFI